MIKKENEVFERVTNLLPITNCTMIPFSSSLDKASPAITIRGDIHVISKL